jgi:hypothetical protein
MRIFLAVIVFDMVFHSLAALTPYDRWLEDLEVERFPKRLPTAQEMRALAAKGYDDGLDPVADRVLDSFDSLWVYFKPWPSSATRKKIGGWGDAGKYALGWLTSRLGFLEQVVRFEQRWTMFSPGVAEDVDMVRTRLVYWDGSTRVVRLEIDPEDLTRYSRWLKGKVVEYSTNLDSDWAGRLGACNLLAHRYPRNRRGAELVKIYLIKFRIKYPDPDHEDIEGFMRRQNGPPGWDKKPAFWEYNLTLAGHPTLGAATVGLGACPPGTGPWSAVGALMAGKTPIPDKEEREKLLK